jgi:hypothetical protein
MAMQPEFEPEQNQQYASHQQEQLEQSYAQNKRRDDMREQDPRSLTAMERTSHLVGVLRELLDTIETRLKDNPDIPENNVRHIEDLLVDFGRRWPEVMYLTGPSGYDPQPVYEVCATCGEYKLAQS